MCDHVGDLPMQTPMQG